MYILCQFEDRVPEFDTVLSVMCTLYVQSTAVGGMGCVSNSKTLDSNRQNTSSPKYYDDISLLISQYLISELKVQLCSYYVCVCMCDLRFVLTE
jgi:hypothetical protein